MKHIIPVVMAGVLGIYGLIIAVIIGNGVQTTKNGVIPAYTGACASAEPRAACAPQARAPLPRSELMRLWDWPSASGARRMSCPSYAMHSG